MGIALLPAPSPPLTPHHGPLLNSAVLHEIANIQLFFYPEKQQFREVEPDRKFSVIPAPIPIRHSVLGCQSI